SSGVTGWLDSTGAQIPSPYTISTSASPVTITYNGLNLPADYWQPQLVTDINASSGTISGTLTLKNTRTGATYTFGSNTYYPGYGPWTLYNNSGTMIPAGNYQVTFTVTTDTNLTVSSLKFIASQWNLYKLTNTTDTQPTVTYVTGGYGQSNTPIGYDGTGNIYWGIYEGDRSYYQYNISTGAVAKFTPANGGDDFYGAGAAYIAHDNTVIFGSDSGTIYKQSVSSFTAQGQTLDLSTIQPDAGQVRSTLAYDGQKILYFTSKGTGANGYLWGIDFTLGVGLPQLQLTGNSTSTPAISDSGYIYVGYNSGFSAGGVVAVLASAFSGTPITIYTGDPVQSSPIVWSDTANDIDYVYFTTNASNSPNHNGYCASYVPGASGGNIVWNPNNPPGVPGSYALQGFAHTSEVGPVVIYGDDSNTLYVFQ
ncbi:MAG: hypothetical protein LBD85_01040, partial [Oscillospiraceae bacterium]|nr:hypothetical protein [Oscillospiraceae bacterium]